MSKFLSKQQSSCFRECIGDLDLPGAEEVRLTFSEDLLAMGVHADNAQSEVCGMSDILIVGCSITITIYWYFVLTVFDPEYTRTIQRIFLLAAIHSQV